MRQPQKSKGTMKQMCLWVLNRAFYCAYGPTHNTQYASPHTACLFATEVQLYRRALCGRSIGGL